MWVTPSRFSMEVPVTPSSEYIPANSQSTRLLM